MLTAFALRGAAAAFSFALNWLIARAFGAEGVGGFSIALTTAVLGSTLSLVGLEYVLLRTVAVEYGQGRSGVARAAVRAAVRQTVLLALLLGGGLFLARDLIADRVMTEPEVAPFLGVMAFAIPIIASAKLASAALRGAGDIATSQAIDGPMGTGVTAGVLAALILAGADMSPLAPAVLYCAFAAAASLFGWIVLRRRMRGWEPAAPYSEHHVRAGLPILGVTVSSLFIDWFAVMLLGSTWGADEAGVFRIAFQIVAVLNLMITALDSVLSPVIAKAYAAGDKARIASVARKAALAFLGLSSPLLLLVFVAPAWTMGLFGPEFVSGAVALQILAVGQAFNIVTGPVGTILVMAKHERWSLAYALVAALIAAGLLWWLVPLYGVMGAAIGVAVATVFRKLAALVIVRFVVGIPVLQRARA